MAVVAGLAALVLVSAAATTTTAPFATIYSYDRVAPNAQVARASISAASGRVAVPTWSDPARPSANAGLGDFVAAEEETAAARTFQTYTKVNPETGEVYAGRTSGFGTPRENIAARDASHAYNERGFGPARLDQSSPSYGAIRGREQQLIEHYQEQGTSANKINGVSPRNPNAPWYLQAATDAFGAGP